MNPLVPLLSNNHKMIDIIRMRKGTEFNIETLKDDLGISRTTADKLFQNVHANKHFPLIMRKGKSLVIDGTLGYFLGISIGSEHIRVVVIDLNFQPVDRNRILIDDKIQAIPNFYHDESSDNSYAFKTPQKNANSLSELRDLLSQIVGLFLALHQQKDASFNLLGIGFGVSGPVDYCAKVWVSSPRITDIQNMTLLDIVGYDNEQTIRKEKIFVSLDNNAKTAVISEYQFLMETHNGSYDKDIALLYIGSGLGFSAVIDQKLLRGSHNMFGEISHVPIITSPPSDESDYKISSQNIEDALEKNGWKNMPRLLPYLLKMINGLLGIDAFILVGHNIKKGQNLIPALMDQRTIFTVESTHRYCNYEVGRQEASTSAIGAAIEAYMTLCAYQTDSENRMNLSHEIKWNTL